MDEFISSSFKDFRSNFLIERDLDKSPRVRLGELSRSLSKANKEAAQKLNSWASGITNKVQRYANKVLKRQRDAQIRVHHIPASDGKSGEAAIVVVKLAQTENVGRGEIEVSVFDNNRFVIQMSDSVARLIKGDRQKVLANKDKAANFVIGILERV